MQIHHRMLGVFHEFCVEGHEGKSIEEILIAVFAYKNEHTTGPFGLLPDSRRKLKESWSSLKLMDWSFQPIEGVQTEMCVQRGKKPHLTFIRLWKHSYEI